PFDEHDRGTSRTDSRGDVLGGACQEGGGVPRFLEPGEEALEKRDPVGVLRALVLCVRHGATVTDAHGEQLGCGARGGKLYRIERRPLPQCAEERFAVRQIYSCEKRERRLLIPAPRRYRRADRRPIQRAYDRIGVEDRTPVGLRRDVMREHGSEIVAGGRNNCRSLSTQKGGDMSETLWPPRRRIDGNLPRSPVWRIIGVACRLPPSSRGRRSGGWGCRGRGPGGRGPRTRSGARSDRGGDDGRAPRRQPGGRARAPSASPRRGRRGCRRLCKRRRGPR